MAMVATAPELVRRCPRLEIVHQTGTRDLEMVRDAYRTAGLSARTESFIDGVANEMRQADVVVSRAGATTLAELSALGVPAVLVPFPAAADDHQRKNAMVLADRGAAVLIEERALDTDGGRAQFIDAIVGLSTDAARRDAVGQAMRGFARPDATNVIVNRILELVA
jgi:UDP-N-acetylglucosamine--N-acetylmuramyl-(pentapeptide) pyrophosphoryl-undecaprenol N-acetylglucosamine transferase